MAGTINRMQLLSGDLDGTTQPIRPPWSLDETRFVTRCDGCGDCIEAYLDQLIRPGRGKLPVMDFSRSGCDFCGDCAAACKRGALQPGATSFCTPWYLKAFLLDHCLARNAVICRACGETCEPRAITFTLCVGGVAKPELDTADCTGCGACLAVCPVQAVSLRPQRPAGDSMQVALELSISRARTKERE